MTTMMLLLLKPVFPYVGKYWIRNVKIFCIYIKNKSSCYPVNVLPGNILAFFIVISFYHILLFTSVLLLELFFT